MNNHEAYCFALGKDFSPLYLIYFYVWHKGKVIIKSTILFETQNALYAFLCRLDFRF